MSVGLIEGIEKFGYREKVEVEEDDDLCWVYVGGMF